MMPRGSLGRVLGSAGARSRVWPVVAAVGGSLALLLSLPLAVHDAGVAVMYVVSHAQGQALPSDFLNYYGAGRTLLEQPAALYVPGLEAALQRSVTGQAELYAQFQNTPDVALFFVPLALLPYGLAYLLWAVMNLALLAACVWLVAPRPARWPARASCALWVVVVLVAYAPAQLALIDGQTTFVVLFGFCAWCASIERARATGRGAGGVRAGSLWLLTWAWKPQLLPVTLLALVLSRAVGRVVLLVGLQALAVAVVVVWSGPPVLGRYVTLVERSAAQDTAGQTVLGIDQALASPDTLTSVAAVIGALLVCALIAWLWWGGLRTDDRRLLQLASLPLGAVLLAPRAYAYELTLWLATAWLVARFVGQSGQLRARFLLLSLLSSVWLAAVLITLSGGAGVPWAALAGVVLLAALAGHCRCRWTSPAS
jgi:hypothetical protein